VVYPIARLLATAQVHEGDVLVIDRHPADKALASYENQKEGLQIRASFWWAGVRVNLRRKRWRERRSEK
jgi:hypothetical protein